MERHRSLSLALVACVLFAGCLTTGSPAGPTETKTTTDHPPSTTPIGTTSEACPSAENVTRKPLPDAPENVTRKSVRSFAAAYEEATVWNRQVGYSTVSIGAHVSEATVVNRTETGYVVHLEGGFSFQDCRGGQRVAGDGIVRTNYFVNETTAIRLEGPETRTVDPRNGGTVVERWG
jgi:hypothetical protein